MSKHTPGPWDNQLETHDDRCEMYSEGCGCESREKLKIECDALRAELDAMTARAREAENDRQDVFDSYTDACNQLVETEAKCDALRAELVERNAARNAYASEFPPDHEGKHNVGIILLNIRNLKSERDALLKALVDLMPLAEFGAAEQSPPYADEHLLNAAQAAIAAARKEGK